MSISVSKIVNLPQAALKFLVEDETEDEARRDFRTLGGVFSGNDYAWLSSGPRLQVVNIKTGNKVGAWSFGSVLKDTNTRIVCVDEIQRPHGRLPLLAVGLDCDLSGGMVCIFDFVTSKVIRAIYIKDRITTLHVIDAGYDVFTLPSPLRNFDGIIAVGTTGGDVLLVDICRQICDEALTVGGLNEIRDEFNPCLLNNITSKEISKIEIHKEFAIRKSQHLAIHINAVFDNSTEHFTLKGPNGDDRIHVNKDEVTVSALYYCPQLGSLLVGYNFGALQLYNLMNLELLYTSPVCKEHIPISHFAVQEPADDPRAFCYVWAVYSANEQFPSCLPVAVMYAFSYGTKEYHEGYGYLYQDFNAAAVHYQMELGLPEGDRRAAKPHGGYCLRLNSISHSPANRGSPNSDSNEENLTLCAIVWNVWFGKKETETFVALFDLNQWYKEQMPNVPSAMFSSTYVVHLLISNLITSAAHKSTPVIDVYINNDSLQQFTGAQRLEEHFCPNSLSFGMCCLRHSDVAHLYNYGVQRALFAQIELSGPMCLVEPADVYQEIIGLGLIPLFIDLPVNTPITTNQQREIILGTALENQLLGWLCKCASEWANGSYLSTGCSLDSLVSWAFQRAVTLKNNSDNFCVPLFDYSEARLDNNTNVLLNSCTRQLKDLCSLYAFILRELFMFISNQELVNEQFKSLQMVSVYFEVLQWLLNVGLLPECPLTAYPRSDDFDRINAPYPAEMLADFYNHRRGVLKILNEENFKSAESVLFIDNLIENVDAGKCLHEQWRNDGGNGLYPPPSLQALLRTYLIDNIQMSLKHSITIYVFLDLAMTLDQDRYKSVVTHLIKFPAVFKVKPSVIKITQAFWQLDHGDYNTAMGLLLDPLIANDDLNEWHHQVALKSLLLQKQHSYALLYVQVRKPVFNTDENIMTAISLYVANNMLDEAFYFEQHSARDSEKFLLHLFNECKKNDKLRPIIYRTLSANDEEFFLKYLLRSKDPSDKDLHVFYHILRSQYIEAFESHDRTVPNQVANLGLNGWENAIPRDKLVHCLKKLLPEIKRALLDVCRKENNNIRIPASRPTPMSCVLNTNQTGHKLSLIGAALTKARDLFHEAVSDKCNLKTEHIPFLRTPKVCINSRRPPIVSINPSIVSRWKDEGVSPAKRLKLSPRRGGASISTSIPTKLDTPVVKRKIPKGQVTPDAKIKMSTPHSILKVKTSVTTEENERQFGDDFEGFEKLEYTAVTPKKSGLGLSPRKSLAKTSPVVRFEGLRSSSGSSLNNSRNLSALMERSESTNQSIEKSSSKNNSSEDVFYSPDTSFEDKPLAVEVQQINFVEESVTEKEDKAVESVFSSPRARRSYKRSFYTTTPIRSSPRLAKIASPQFEVPSPVKESLSLPEESLKVSPSSLPKLRPRKSLCRQVLETNALNNVLNSSPRSRKIESSVTETEEIVEKIESSVKYDDGEESYKATSITKHNLVTSVVESDLDTSEDYAIDFELAEEPVLSTVREVSEIEGSKTVESGETVMDNKLETTIENKLEKTQDVLVSLSEPLVPTVLDADTASQENLEAVGVDDDEKPEEVVQVSASVGINLKAMEEKVSSQERISPESEDRDDTDDKDGPINSPDPEMNVFEISDDLSFTENLQVEKEVTLEEDDLCYDQQNTLESVLEENVTATTNVFEKNVFDEGISDSEEGSHLSQKSESEESSPKGSEDEEDEEHRQPSPPTTDENEVIEIGSSSDEEATKEESSESEESRNEEANEEESSEYESDRSCEERKDVAHEPNIYDSEEDSSEKSNYERRYSEISDNSNDSFDESREVSSKKSSEDEDGSEGSEEEDHSSDSAEEVQDAKLFDEDQFITKIEDHSEEDDNSKEESLDQTEMECGLFHGEILVDDESKDRSEGIPDDEEEEMKEAQLFDEDQFVTKAGEEIEDRDEETDNDKEEGDESKIGEVEEETTTNEELDNKNKNLDASEADVKKQELPIIEEDLETKPVEQEIRVDDQKCQLSVSLEETKAADRDDEKLANRDPLDPAGIPQRDRDDSNAVVSASRRTSKRNNSVSEVSEKAMPLRRSARKNSQQSETESEETTNLPPKRVLRPRRASTDEAVAPSLTLRKRSSSVDAITSTELEASRKEEAAPKSRKHRTASAASLPRIVEENVERDVVTRRKAKSVVEGYSMNRRVTRQQKAALMKVDMGGATTKIDLEYLDPIVFLDRVPFQGQPDPEEKKVYEKSPSSTKSPGTAHTPPRKLRSTSSEEYKDKTPFRRRRTASPEEGAVPRMTRSRSRSTSISSVRSEDLAASTTVKGGKRRQLLPEIKEEPESTLPKKRAKKGGSKK